VFFILSLAYSIEVFGGFDITRDKGKIKRFDKGISKFKEFTIKIKNFENEKQLGYISGYIFNLEKIENSDFPKELVFDNIDSAVKGVYISLTKENGDWKEDILGPGNHLVFLDMLYIYPKHRGKKIGAHTLKFIDKIIGYNLNFYTSCFVLKPDPFEQRDNKDKDSYYLLREEEKEKKLRNYYKRIGFKEIPDDVHDWEFMYYNPSVDELNLI